MTASTRARDHWLALRCQAGVPGAFDDLIAEFERPLLYYAVKITGSQDTALDVLQEAWIRALRGIRKLKEPSAVRAWLYKLVHGAAVDRIRRNRSREHAEEVHAEVSARTDEPEFTAADAAAIHQILDRLDEKHREVLVLHFLEDFSLAEIAAILGCPEGTVKSRLYYAKKALRKAIPGVSNAIQP